mgnify:FL=1
MYKLAITALLSVAVSAVHLRTKAKIDDDIQQLIDMFDKEDANGGKDGEISKDEYMDTV